MSQALICHHQHSRLDALHDSKIAAGAGSYAVTGTDAPAGVLGCVRQCGGEPRPGSSMNVLSDANRVAPRKPCRGLLRAVSGPILPCVDRTLGSDLSRSQIRSRSLQPAGYLLGDQSNLSFPATACGSRTVRQFTTFWTTSSRQAFSSVSGSDHGRHCGSFPGSPSRVSCQATWRSSLPIDARAPAIQNDRQAGRQGCRRSRDQDRPSTAAPALPPRTPDRRTASDARRKGVEVWMEQVAVGG